MTAKIAAELTLVAVMKETCDNFFTDSQAVFKAKAANLTYCSIVQE